MPGSKKKKSDSGGNGVAATEGGNTQPDDARKPAALEFHPAIDGDTKSLMLDQVGQAMPECSSCGEGVGYDRSYFFLSGCKHILCGSCFAEVGLNRGCDAWYRCPDTRGCNALSDGYYEAKNQPGQRRSDDEIRVVGQLKILPAPDVAVDSFRGYREQHKDVRASHAAFQASFDDGGIVKTISNLVPNGSTPIEMSGGQKDALVAIGRKLHSTLMIQDRREQEQKPAVSFPSVGAVLDDVNGDCGTLRRFLHAVATGGDLKEALGNETDEYDHLETRPSWAAAQILRAPTNPNSPGLFAQANAQLLSILGTPAHLKKYLSKFRLCSNKEAVRLADAEAVNGKIAEGWDFSSKVWGLLIILYDNIGFKKRGAKPGYDQFTAVKVESVPYEELRRVKVYSDSPAERLSRERTDWEDIRSRHRSERKARLFLVTKEEQGIYSERVLNTNQVVLESYNDYPTLGECLDAAEAWETEKVHRDWDRTKVSAEFGERPTEDEYRCSPVPAPSPAAGTDQHRAALLVLLPTPWPPHHQPLDVDLGPVGVGIVGSRGIIVGGGGRRRHLARSRRTGHSQHGLQGHSSSYCGVEERRSHKNLRRSAF